MSVVEISSRIRNPNLVVPDDLSTLQELSTKYPYTQLFSILYLKALSKAGDPRFEEELSRHSFRISDRVQLYELIQGHDETETLVIPTETVENPIETVEEPQEVPIETIAEKSTPTETIETDTSPISNEVNQVVSTPELEPEVNAETETETIIFENKVEESPEIIPEPIAEETKIETQDNLEESILHNVYAANYHLDDLTDEEEKALAHDEEVKKEETTASLNITEEKTAKNKQEASSFTGWLHSNANYAEGDTSDKEAINAVVEDFSEFDPSSELFGEVKKPKTEFFSPTKKAKKSLEESELPVSETLAKIYIMQGNYPQAISAYKQLSLAFPEKKIFFANLIEDLEKKINT